MTCRDFKMVLVVLICVVATSKWGKCSTFPDFFE